MAKLKLIITVFVTAGVTSLLIWQYSANERLRRDNESLRGAIAELKQSQEVHAPTSDGDSATKEQLAELLKLRGEVTQLRGQTNEIAALRQQNEALIASIKAVPASTTQAQPIERKKKSPEDALPQDIHPKESWGYRGYATPEATVESLCWAMMSGDRAAFLGGLSPEMRAQVEKDTEGKDFAEDIKKVGNAEFRILDRRQLSDDKMVLTIYTTRDNPNGDTRGSSEDTVFQRFNGEWKVTDEHSPDN